MAVPDKRPLPRRWEETAETVVIGAGFAGFAAAAAGTAVMIFEKMAQYSERLPDRRPTHLALTQDVDDILHPSVDPLECAVVSGEVFSKLPLSQSARSRRSHSPA